VTPLQLRRIDALLLLMAIIWGSNYVIIKHAFRELDPQAFNAIRMVVASAVFLASMAAIRNLPARRIEHEPRLRVVRCQVLVPVRWPRARVFLLASADAAGPGLRALLSIRTQCGHFLFAEVLEPLACKIGRLFHRRAVLVGVRVDPLQVRLTPRRLWSVVLASRAAGPELRYQ